MREHPQGWEYKRLVEIADIRPSNVDKKTTPGELAIRLCNYLDVYSNDNVTDALDFMEATARPEEIIRFKVESGDVIITKDSETPDDIGIPAVCRSDIPDLVCGYHLALIKPDRKQVEPVFLSAQIAHPRTSHYFTLRAHGSTRFGLTFSSIANTLILLPPLPEQRRIAAILDAADEAIRSGERIIAKLRQVKAGALHDLLTCGVDAQGRLRDPRAHPEHFKDSPLGRIPREWAVKELETCVSTDITYGIVQAGPHIENGIPYIRTGDMSGEKLEIEGLLKTSPAIAASFKRSEVHTGEIVCAIRATVGKVLEVPPELDGANLTQGTARIAPNLDVNGHFLLWALRSNMLQRQFEMAVKGTTFREITLGALRLLWLPLPIPAEQTRIAAILDAHDARLRAEEAAVAKLRQVKAGLMEDLLTGRVRV